MLHHDFVLHPDRFLTPAYRISPFRTSDIAANRALPVNGTIDDYFRERFRGRSFVYCQSGRQAIHLALRALSPTPQDAVTILTTTGNLYISGCVTREIEKFCRWSRKFESETRIVLVNHEFGFPFETLHELRGRQTPIIEDAAHSFASENVEGSISRAGEFTVYSFPKYFSVQFGGLLVFDPSFTVEEPLDHPARTYLQNVLSARLPHLQEIQRKRQENHNYLAAKFATLGCSPRFELTDRTTPGVFMFRAPAGIDLPGLKTFAQAHGIESSVFYGEQTFFVPVHERLEEGDLDYFFEVCRCYFESVSSP